MKLRKITSLGLLGLASLLVLSLYSLHNKGTSADAPGIVINEIMYNPGTGNQNDEFIELYNTTGSSIDISNWKFSQGITLATGNADPTRFGPGTVIGPNAYYLLSPETSRTQETYGVSSNAWYAPSNLSNGGEIITLVDGSDQVIDSFEYDDATPWPVAPDGSGPSLELKDPEIDNSQAVNWAASLANGGTPGAQNSIFGAVLPEVSLVTKPSGINPSDTPLVTVQADNVDGVELYYRFGFEAEQQLTMHDDGAHGDGAASDGNYGVNLPAQVAGGLVRYRIVATSGSASASVPSSDDSMDYDGYVVNDGVTSQAPILRWFVSDEAYADILDNLEDDDSYRKSVLEYDGQVYDNTDFRLKGEYSRTFPKKGFKFKLPSGYTINMAGGSDRSISEFHMNSNWMDGTSGITPTAWWLVDQAGMITPDISPARMQRNGQFEGVYVFAEKYEKEWRQEHGYDTGNIYEDFWEKKQGTPELDRSDIEEWREEMSAFNDQAKREYVLDNNDIPNLISYTAVQALLKANDNTATTNTFAYHDTEGTGRWSVWVWDLDIVFSGSRLAYLTPYDIDPYLLAEDRFPTTAFYQQQDMREMYYRRLRTLIDKVYSNDALKNQYQSELQKYLPDMELDRSKWPDDMVYDDPVFGDYARYRQMPANYEYTIDQQKINLLHRYTLDWGIPESQKQEDIEQVYIEEVGTDPLDDGNEYVKISNSSGEYVDISEWQIDGLSYTIPAGTVVPSGGSIYLVKNDVAYRASHNPVFIAGQYETSISIGGPNVLMLKSNSNQVIDSYTVAE